MADFITHLVQHAELAATAILFGGSLGLVFGLAAFEIRFLTRPLLGMTALLRVIPSLAVFMLGLPFLGIGTRPAELALIILAIAPVAIAVDSGLRAVPSAVRENGVAMGLTGFQLRKAILWPLALPTVLGGVRTAAVEAIASAALAAFIGAGGLGEYILEGLATGDTARLLIGAGSVALLALVVETALAQLQHSLELRLA